MYALIKKKKPFTDKSNVQNKQKRTKISSHMNNAKIHFSPLVIVLYASTTFILCVFFSLSFFEIQRLLCYEIFIMYNKKCVSHRNTI